MSDELLGVYIALEDMIRNARELKHTVGQMIAEREATVQKILNAVRESDECTASFGGCIPPQVPRVEAPSDGHMPTPAHICCEACDDLD